jgi:phage tail-like protein
MSFAEVSGLVREHQVVTYRHGLSFVEGEDIVKFRIDKYSSITLKRGTTTGAGSLYAWLESKQPKPMEVQLCDAGGTPVIAWSVIKALPIKLDAPTFDAKTNDAVIETLELKAAGISVKELG